MSTNGGDTRLLNHLDLFGGPVLRRATGEVVPLTPLHQRLLTLVWGHSERGIPRGAAIWLLWEDEDDSRSRHRLRQLLHDLGSRVGFRPVAPDGEEFLAPTPGLVTSDLDEFAAALTDRKLRHALGLLEAGFASKLNTRGCGEDLEDWILAKREGLQRKLKDAAAWQWDRFHPLGAWDHALDAAEVLAALDPGSESSALKVIEARAMTGNLVAAEAAVDDLMEHLGRGRELSREGRHLVERIRRMEPVQSFLPSSAPPPPPLVGRRANLATARGMLGRVGEGGFEFLLIVGEAGAGKTRILEEVWREANLAGFRCLEARPAEVERRIPLNPLVDMMADPWVIRHIKALEEPWRAVIASLLPQLPEGMDPPVVPPIAETSLSRRLFDAFSILLSALSDTEPVMLFVDDLQWADATTIAVLQFVQRRWRAGPLGIVATLRKDLVSGGDGVAKYLTDSADLPTTLVEVPDLSDEEARRLVELVAGDAVEPLMVQRLCALGGRNPFYLVELTRDYLRGRVHIPELPTEAITLPISLRQLLDPRIKEAGDEAASVGSVLAVLGRGIGLPDLAALMGMPVDTTASRVEELERCRLATVERGKVRLTHELFRSAMYQGLTATRKALLHGQVARFLEGVEPRQAGEMAIHYDRAGDAPEAAARAREAADRALESGAMAEAAYFLQLVLENETDPRLKAEATGDLARVFHLNREIMRANPLLELAASRLRAVGNHRRALRMDIRRVEGLAELGTTPLSELLDRLATIKAAARTDGDDEALALALDSELHLLHRSGEVEAIRALFVEIRKVAASDDPAAACLANASLALNVLFGDAEEALRCAREAVRVAEEGGVTRHLLLAKNKLFFALLYLGRGSTDEALTTLVHARRLATKSGDLMMRFHLESNTGVACMDAGDLDGAETHFERAGALLVGADARVMKLNHTYNLGELAYMRGDAVEALHHFYAAEALLSSSAQPRDIELLLNASIGLCSIEIGALADARAREAALHPLPSAWHFDPTMLLTFLARLMESRGHRPQALSMIRTHQDTLRDRLPMAWLKLLMVEARLGKRLKDPTWRERLGEGLSVADELRLTHRAASIRAELASPRAKR